MSDLLVFVGIVSAIGIGSIALGVAGWFAVGRIIEGPPSERRQWRPKDDE